MAKKQQKKNTQTVDEHNIIKFIQHLNEKNYSKANKYLQTSLHEKIKDRISKSLKGPLFKK